MKKGKKKKPSDYSLSKAINTTKEVPHFPTLVHDSKENKKRLIDKANKLADKENS